MANKQKRRRASGYTVGPARIRRRRLNGAKTTRRRSARRMNGAMTSQAKDVLGMAVGAIVGGFAIGAAEKLTPNPYVRAGGVALVGLVVANKVPSMRTIGQGMAVAGVVRIGQEVMAKSGIMPGTLNRARLMPPGTNARITRSLQNAQLPTLNGEPAMLNGAASDAVVIY